MQTRNVRFVLVTIVLAALVATACKPATTATPAPLTRVPAATATIESAGGFQIPAIENGKFNIAMVLIGPHDDGGCNQAHYDGLLYVEQNVTDTHVAYIELVPEGA